MCLATPCLPVGHNDHAVAVENVRNFLRNCLIIHALVVKVISGDYIRIVVFVYVVLTCQVAEHDRVIIVATTNVLLILILVHCSVLFKLVCLALANWLHADD